MAVTHGSDVPAGEPNEAPPPRTRKRVRSFVFVWF